MILLCISGVRRPHGFITLTLHKLRTSLAFTCVLAVIFSVRAMYIHTVTRMIPF